MSYQYSFVPTGSQAPQPAPVVVPPTPVVAPPRAPIVVGPPKPQVVAPPKPQAVVAKPAPIVKPQAVVAKPAPAVKAQVPNRARITRSASPGPSENPAGELVFTTPDFPGPVTLQTNTLDTFVSLTMTRSFVEVYELLMDTEGAYKICIKYCSGGHKRAQRFWSVGPQFLFALPCACGKVKLRFSTA